MKITIKNPSSAGTSFTPHTCNVICKCYEFIKESIKRREKFIDFRRGFATKYRTNDNNNRNIFPFLKYAGFITYGYDIEHDKFFTDLGMAFVKVLILQDYVEVNVQDEALKRNIEQKLDVIKQNLICAGLRNIIKCNECRYRRELFATIKFLQRYNAITIEEFAYLIYALNEDESNFLDNIEQNLKSYRQGDLDIEVAIDIRDADGNRSEADISRLTSYDYYISVLNQAGVTFKDGSDNNNKINMKMIEYITSLVKE